MTYPDRRTDDMIEEDRLTGKPDHLIEAYNHGWAWHTESFVAGNSDLRNLLATTPYALWDDTPEGIQFWLGFEHATKRRWQEIRKMADKLGLDVTVERKAVHKEPAFDPVAEAEALLREESDADGS